MIGHRNSSLELDVIASETLANGGGTWSFTARPVPTDRGYLVGILGDRSVPSR